MIERIKTLTTQAMAHSGLRKYGTNMSWLFAEKIFRMLIGFTVGIYVARQLGPEKLGLLNYAISFAAIFSCVVSLGLDQIVVRELVKQPNKRDALLGTVFMLRLAGFILMLFGVTAGLTISGNDWNTNLIVLVIAAGYLFQIFQAIEVYFQAKVLSKYIAISQVIAWTIISIFRALFAYWNVPLLYFAYLESGNMLLTSVAYIVSYYAHGNVIFRWTFRKTVATSLLKDSWPLLLSGITGVIYLRIDQVMIKSMLGDSDVGYYSVAVRLVELWYFLPMVICFAVFPAIIKAKEISKELYLLRLKKLFAIIFWLAFIVALPISLFGKYIILFLYGSEYSLAAPILMIYAWRTISCFVGVASSSYLISENLQKYSLIFTAIGAIVNVIMNYILINKLGVAGSAWAALGTTLAIVYICPFLFNNTRELGYMVIKAVFPVGLIKRAVM
ncbi:MAG: flippase [Bacteroidales bacterium]|nr:flippase [Bacteroidales bacterium]